MYEAVATHLKKNILHIILLSLIGLISCKTYQSDSKTDITEKEVYDFMRFIGADLKIADTVDIQTKPFTLFFKEPNRNYFKIADFTLLGNESDEYSQRVFKSGDTIFVKNQNIRIVNGFEWNKEKLGFKKNENNPMKIYLSLPYFSTDKKTVVIFKRYENTSAFMAGGWKIMKYIKTENGWDGQSIRSALN